MTNNNGNGHNGDSPQIMRLVSPVGAVEVQLTHNGSYVVAVKRPQDAGWRQTVSGNVRNQQAPPTMVAPEALKEPVELPGGMTIDPRERTCTVRGERVKLANLEFQLLAKLCSDPYRVFTKDELLRDVWGFKADPATRTLDSHASRLRQKLREHGYFAVESTWGVGYKLLDSSQVAA